MVSKIIDIRQGVTTDLDVVVNARVKPPISEFVKTLQKLGYESNGV